MTKTPNGPTHRQGPYFWQEQLGISDETQLDTDKLTAEIQKLLHASS